MRVEFNGVLGGVRANTLHCQHAFIGFLLEMHEWKLPISDIALPVSLTKPHTHN